MQTLFGSTIRPLSSAKEVEETFNQSRRLEG